MFYVFYHDKKICKTLKLLELGYKHIQECNYLISEIHDTEIL